jgi:hypothetical protein
MDPTDDQMEERAVELLEVLQGRMLTLEDHHELHAYNLPFRQAFVAANCALTNAHRWAPRDTPLTPDAPRSAAGH